MGRREGWAVKDRMVAKGQVGFSIPNAPLLFLRIKG